MPGGPYSTYVQFSLGEAALLRRGLSGRLGRLDFLRLRGRTLLAWFKNVTGKIIATQRSALLLSRQNGEHVFNLLL